MTVGCCPWTSTWRITSPLSTTTDASSTNAIVIEEHTECGSGCHGHHVPHELEADEAALSSFDRTLLKRVVATAVADYQKHRGSVPGGLARWAQQTLRPKVNWRQQARVGAALQRAPQDRHSGLHMAAPLPPPAGPRSRAAPGHDPPRAVHHGGGGHLRIHGRARTRPGPSQRSAPSSQASCPATASGSCRWTPTSTPTST